MLGLFTWFGLFAIILVYGAPIGLLLTRDLRPTTIRIAMWSGLLLLVTLSTFSNLFIPLKSAAAIVVVLVVAVLTVALAFVLSRRRSSPILPPLVGWTALSKASWFLVGVLAVVSIWWLVAATRAPTNYDSGLYHLQSIWYAADFKTIPGLANLYASLGFGNSLMPLTAITTNGPMGLEAYRVINGFFFLLLFVEVLLRLSSSRRNSVGTKTLLIGLGVFVAPMIWMADYWVISPTFDTPVAILTLVSVAALADALASGRKRSVDVVGVIVPIALAASMRQHYWFLFAFFALIILWVALGRKTQGVLTAFWLSVGASSVLLVVMLVRDFVLSGWVLYPYKIFSFNVDWVAPDPAGLINSTKLWARSPTPAYQQMGDGWAWVRPWLGANLITWVFFAILGCLILTVIAFFFARKIWRPRALLLVMAPLFLYLITWFFVGAPHVRYSWAPLLLMGAVPLAWVWQAIEVHHGGRFQLMNLAQFLVGIELIVVVVVAATVAFPRLATEMPMIAVDKVPLNSTVDLLVPQGTDQCWSHFPVCSGMPAAGLALRGNTVVEGFKRITG